MRRNVIICISLVAITVVAYWQAWVPGVLSLLPGMPPTPPARQAQPANVPPGQPAAPQTAQPDEEPSLLDETQKLGLEFVYFDDPGYITDNTYVKKGLTPETITWAFTCVGEQSNWHPLSWCAHMLDVTMFGVNSLRHHIANIILHSASAVLLFLLLRWMTSAVWPSALVAALFAIHPMHVESVAWVAERKDVLSTLIELATIFAYVWYCRKQPKRRPALLDATAVLSPMVVLMFGLVFGLIVGALYPQELREITYNRMTAALGIIFGAQGLLCAPAALLYGAPFGWMFSVLALLFSLLGLALAPLGALVISGDRQSAKRLLVLSLQYTLVVFLYATGLMTKPMLVTFPCLLLLLDFWPLGRVPGIAKVEAKPTPRPTPAMKPQAKGNGRRKPGQPAAPPPSTEPGIWSKTLGRLPWLTMAWLVVEKVPLFVLTAASCHMTFVAQKVGGSVAPVAHLPWATRITNILLSYVTYIVMLFWPSNMAAFYPLIPEDIALTTTETTPANEVLVHYCWGHIFLAVGAALLLLLITAAVLWGTWRGRRYLGVGWLWFVGTLVPVIGIVQVGDQYMADRYAYISYVGLFIILAWGIAELFARWPATRFVVAAAAVLLVSGCVAVNIPLDFGSTSVEQGQQLALHAPGSDAGATEDPAGAPMWMKTLIFGLLMAGLWAAAEALAWRSYRRITFAGAATAVLAGCLVVTIHQVNYWHDTVLLLQHCIEVQPKNHTACNNLGVKCWELNRKDEAMKYWKRALELRPGYADAHSNFGFACKEKYAQCIQQSDEAKSPDEKNRLAAEANQWVNQAIGHFLAAIQCNPQLAKAYNNLGLVYLVVGARLGADAQKADAEQRKADAERLRAESQKMVKQAEEMFLKAIDVRPEELVAHENLARLYWQQAQDAEKKANEAEKAGKHEEAVKYMEERNKKYTMAEKYLKNMLFLAPGNPVAINSLVLLLVSQNKFAEATDFCRQMAERDPKNLDVRHNWGVVLIKQGRIREAIDAWRSVIEAQPKAMPTRAQLAWVLATCPDAALRIGAQAVELAEGAVQLTGGKDPTALDTLGAAYAETGQFAKAIEFAERAMFEASNQGKSEMIEQIRSRLELYRAGMPYRDGSLVPPPNPPKK